MMATMATTTAITTGVTTELEPVPPERSNLDDEFLSPGLGPTVLTWGTTKYEITVQVLCVFRARPSLGLFRNRITPKRRCSCSFRSYSVFGMNGMIFRSFCSR